MNQLFKPFLRQKYWGEDVRAAAEFVVAKHGQPFHVVTLTSEMILHAIKHPEVMAAIFSSDMIVADTISLTLWLKANKVPVQRVTGIDLAEAVIRGANGPTVAILGGGSVDIRTKAGKKIETFGGHAVLSHEGPRIFSYTHFDDANLVAELNAAQPKIVLVAFGHGKQEWWISKIKKELTYPAILIGVGGTLDVWGGAFSRAPHVVRTLGLEWLWRLIQEPTRIRRIIDAVIVFPYRAFVEDLL